jgi:hypothetical protein
MAAGERVPARRRLRMSAGLFGLLLGSVAGLAMFGTLSVLLVPDAYRSSYTQQHGVQDPGTISSITNTRSDRGGWSAAVQITLDRPVSGVTSTTLHVGNAVHSPVGTPETVLVDPQDPSYAVYPGQDPHALLGVVLLFLVPTGVSALLFLFTVWRLAVLRYRNRGLPPPPTGRHRHQHATRARSRVGGLPRFPQEIIAPGSSPGGLLWAQLSGQGPCLVGVERGAQVEQGIQPVPADPAEELRRLRGGPHADHRPPALPAPTAASGPESTPAAEAGKPSAARATGPDWRG